MKKILAVAMTMTMMQGIAAFAQDSAQSTQGSGDSSHSADSTSSHRNPSTGQVTAPQSRDVAPNSQIQAGGQSSKANKSSSTTASGSQAQKQGKSAKSQQWKAHSMLAHTYLQAAQQFVKGLDRSVDERFPMSEREVRLQGRRYGQEALQNMQAAKKELNQMKQALSSDGLRENNEFRQYYQTANRNIDEAISHDRALMERFANAESIKSKQEIDKHISKLESSLSDALDQQKNLAGLDLESEKRKEAVSEM